MPDKKPALKIWSFGFSYGERDWPKGVDVYDAQDLPDPHSDITLRHLNGLDPKVQQFMLDLDGIDDWFDSIVSNLPKVGIAIGCFGGVHRSVSLAEELGRRLGVTPKHLDLAKRAPWKNIPEWEHERKAQARAAWVKAHMPATTESWTKTATVSKKSKVAQNAAVTPPAGHRKDEYCPWCGQRSAGKKLHVTCKLEQKRSTQTATTAKKAK